MAMACFLLFTFFPLLPLFKLPLFRLCIARLTDRCAPFPYRAIFSSTSSSLQQAFADKVRPHWQMSTCVTLLVEVLWYVLCRLYKP